MGLWIKLRQRSLDADGKFRWSGWPGIFLIWLLFPPVSLIDAFVSGDPGNHLIGALGLTQAMLLFALILGDRGADKVLALSVASGGMLFATSIVGAVAFPAVVLLMWALIAMICRMGLRRPR